MAFPWIDERIANMEIPERNENLLLKKKQSEIVHGVPSRPAQAFADFNLRERKHYESGCGNDEAQAAPRAKVSSLGAGLGPLDDGRGASCVLGDAVMHIDRAAAGQARDGGGINLLGQRADASMRAPVDDGSFSVKKWRRSKKQVDPAYGPGSPTMKTRNNIIVGSTVQRSDDSNVQFEGTFRSAGHIVGYQGHISRVNPDNTRAAPQGRSGWNKDLLVANHREHVSGYSGFRK